VNLPTLSSQALQRAIRTMVRPAGKTAKPKAKPTVKSKKSTVQAVSYVEGTMKLSAAKSSQKVATETLSSIQNEALNEIVEKLVKNPEKIWWS
jgi:excinuclease UvrABC ATPase subunit